MLFQWEIRQCNPKPTICECQPNYLYSAQTNSCEYKSCKFHTDCDRFDSNRVCVNMTNENNTVNGM